MKAAAKGLFARCWLAALLLLVWQILTAREVLAPLFFPPPSKVIGAGLGLLASAELGHHLGYTLTRTATGYAAGAVLALLATAALFAAPWLRTAAWPLVSAAYATPRLTLLPMAMLIFGVNEFSRVLLVTLSTFLIVVLQVSDAVRGVNPDFVHLARNYGAGPSAVLWRVYVPACLPQGFTALRQAFGRALVLTISVELLSCDTGLGSMIWSSWQSFATERLYSTVLLAGALGLVTHAAFEWLERRLTPWENRRP